MAYRCPTNNNSRSSNRFAALSTNYNYSNQFNQSNSTTSAFSSAKRVSPSKRVSFAPSTKPAATSDGYQIPKQHQRNYRKRAKFSDKRQRRTAYEENKRAREERAIKAQQLAAQKKKKDAEEQKRLDWLNQENTEFVKEVQEQKLAGSAWSRPMPINMNPIVDFRPLQNECDENEQEEFQPDSNYNWADMANDEDEDMNEDY